MTPEKLERLGLRVYQAQPGLKGLRVIPAILAQLGPPAQPVLRGHRGPLETLEQLDPRAIPETLAQPVHRAYKAKQG